MHTYLLIFSKKKQWNHNVKTIKIILMGEERNGMKGTEMEVRLM